MSRGIPLPIASQITPTIDGLAGALMRHHGRFPTHPSKIPRSVGNRRSV